MSASPEPSLATIALIGAGRLGGVLAGALHHAGFAVQGPFGREDRIPASDIALLCVPDAEIPAAAAKARPHATLVGHVSGATNLDDVDFSIHPLQTFTGAEAPDVFHGIGAAVAGRTPEALRTATRLADALGAHPFTVDDVHRATYHAAASLASNLVLTVLDAAEQVALAAGIRDPRTLLAPLVARTVDNWTRDGAAVALTGPIARGDDATVQRQQDAVSAATPGLIPLFDQLCTSTRDLAATDRRAAADPGAATDRVAAA
ncbi:Rossmann-like and DUF2520 domain-containing protein [Microbacterium suwonense]|uniref:DUF2520 domain-containing protein n=1 Tax=Microbacterium suwonense TaxID=683047 RepID=A0ABM8FVN2_9MICO|nr:Rossmann-like and DUF2520 domain-containing protein [Microbacterium suwonense]BDZ39776.1 hypothetical protein GCM10025863_23900 [Microbacterium suwonense]